MKNYLTGALCQSVGGNNCGKDKNANSLFKRRSHRRRVVRALNPSKSYTKTAILKINDR